MTDDANPGCFFCNRPEDKTAHAIRMRLGKDPSFAELWARLDQAERDRDRMMNALQLVRDTIQQDKVNRHTMTLINRALSRIQPIRPTLSATLAPGGAA